jgi:hypothetical protein
MSSCVFGGVPPSLRVPPFLTRETSMSRSALLRNDTVGRWDAPNRRANGGTQGRTNEWECAQ